MNRKMRSFHRTMGAIVALFVIVLAVTGVALNHADDLKLNKRYINWDWLMTWYGIGQSKPDAVYLIDNKVISQFGNQLFVDAKPVTHVNKLVLGGVSLDAVIVLATQDSLVLLNHNGEFVERMDATAGVPSQIQNIGLFHGDPVLQTRNGMFRSNYMLDQWERISLEGVTWSVSYSMPASIDIKLKHYFYGKGISVEQFILDIHNGHILGTYGVWVIDVLGVLLVILALTGLWMWGRRLH